MLKQQFSFGKGLQIQPDDGDRVTQFESYLQHAKQEPATMRSRKPSQLMSTLPHLLDMVDQKNQKLMAIQQTNRQKKILSQLQQIDKRFVRHKSSVMKASEQRNTGLMLRARRASQEHSPLAKINEIEK